MGLGGPGGRGGRGEVGGGDRFNPKRHTGSSFHAQRSLLTSYGVGPSTRVRAVLELLIFVLFLQTTIKPRALSVPSGGY